MLSSIGCGSLLERKTAWPKPQLFQELPFPSGLYIVQFCFLLLPLYILRTTIMRRMLLLLYGPDPLYPHTEEIFHVPGADLFPEDWKKEVVKEQGLTQSSDGLPPRGSWEKESTLNCRRLEWCCRLMIISCPRPYFSGIGSGNIAYIELFQRDSIIADVNT